MPDHFTNIHTRRQDCGRTRQPTYDQELTALGATIQPPHHHPYKLPEWQLRNLMSNPWFKVGGRGLNAPATLPASGFVYRICPVKKLTDYSSGWFSNSPARDAQPPFIFNLFKKRVERLEQASGGRKVWLRLRRYARGEFASPRQFTFWTGCKLDPSDPVRLLQTSHALGLPNDWLDEYAVVLRCDTRLLRIGAPAQIPTTLDGFDSHIFHPRREAMVPPSGVTIELSLIPPLHRGQDEYALGPVETTAIEVYPVRLPQTPYIKSDDLGLLTSLDAYYRQL